MIRNLQQLASTEFDLLVVGAGIYGATIACDAAQRGLSVALIDRADFGGGTSLNSLRTVHGGLRALQRGDIADVRLFVRERRALLRIAPHLVEPLRFLIPTYGAGIRGRTAMRLAFIAYGTIARDRNRGLDPARWIPDSAVVDREETLRLFPGLDRSRVTGGAAWHEAQMYNADRVLLGFVQSAVAEGAQAANYVAAAGFLRAGDRVIGVAARDELSGDTLEIRARVTVNASGGWASALTASAFGDRASPPFRMSKAFNLVTRQPAPACGLGDSVDGQFLFAVPWRGVTAFGTLHAQGGANGLEPHEAEVTSFLRLVNRAFPAARVTLDDVTLVHRGLLPAIGASDARVQLVKTSYVRDHRLDGVAGLITVIGVRYTTARATAERAVDVVAALLGRTLRPSRSATTPLAGGAIADMNRFLAEAQSASPAIDGRTLTRLARSYGTVSPRLVAMIERDPELGRPLGRTCAVTSAEVLYALHSEMAMHLSDALLRRTEAGSSAHPGRDAVDAAAAIAAAQRGWDPVRTAAEIDAVNARYRLAP